MLKSLRLSGYGFIFLFSILFLFPLQTQAADVISGVVYSDKGVSAVTTGDKTVAILVNGALAGSDVTDANGVYSIDTGVTIVEGDVITAFVSGAVNSHGVNVTLADGSLSDLDIYYDYIIARHEGSDPITRADLEVGNNGNPDIAVLYDDDSVVFNLNNAVQFFVPSGNTMQMGSPTDSTGSLDIEGVLDLGIWDVMIEGDLVGNGTVDYDQAGNSEIIFDGSGVSTIDFSGALPRIVVEGGGTLNLNASLDVNNGILVSSGSTLDAGVHAIDLEGSIDVTSGSTFTAPSSTLTVAGNLNIKGVFFHNSGEIILDSGSDQDVFGANMYFDFTIADSGARIIGFEEDQTQVVGGTFSADLGDLNVGSMRTINSSGAVLGDGSLHTLNVSGSIGQIAYLDIRDSVLQISGSVVSPAQNIATSINRGNTLGWFDLSLIGVVDGVESGLDAAFDVVASVPNNTGSDVVVDYIFSGGTANPGVNNDYDDSTTSVIIPDGQSSARIIVPISTDTNDGEGLETIEITLVSASGDYDVVTTPASRTIMSTLIPEFYLSENALEIPEGSQGAFDISLNRAPFGTVTLVAGSSSIAEATVSPSVVTFDASNWDVPQTVTVNSVDDDVDRDGDSSSILVNISATPVDRGFNDLASQSIEVTFEDNDESTVTNENTIEIYRFYSALYRGHFYTISVAERDSLIANDPNWVYEGVFANAASADQVDTSPVYRFWSSNYRHHFFTISVAERDSLIANDPNWVYEGEAYNAYEVENSLTTPVFRFWSPVYLGHFYTISEAERDALISGDPNWSYEGLAWHVPQ